MQILLRKKQQQKNQLEAVNLCEFTSIILWFGFDKVHVLFVSAIHTKADFHLARSPLFTIKPMI